jgi:hypothetical protein
MTDNQKTAPTAPANGAAPVDAPQAEPNKETAAPATPEPANVPSDQKHN